MGKILWDQLFTILTSMLIRRGPQLETSSHPSRIVKFSSLASTLKINFTLLVIIQDQAPMTSPKVPKTKKRFIHRVTKAFSCPKSQIARMQRSRMISQDQDIIQM